MMKAYELKKRLKKTHGKAKFVGFLYLIGAIAMTACACLPIFTLNGKQLWIKTFWRGLNVFGKVRDWFNFGVSVLYTLMLLTVAINLLKCLGKLGNLFRASAKTPKGYNRNLRAMDEMGKLFSGSFSAIVGFHFLIYIANPAGAIKFTYIAYAVAGLGLFFHFFCGLIGAKTSVFNVDRNGVVEEEKRPCKLFVYFFRNIVQLAAVAVIAWYFAKNCNFYDEIQTVLLKKNPFGGGVMKVAVPLLLEGATVLWILVLLAHATNVTEFNRLGIEGSGMKNFRVFAFLTALTAGGWFALAKFYNKTNPTWAFAIIAGVAFGAFLVDCIFKSKPKDSEKEKLASEETGTEGQQPFMPTGYPYPAYMPPMQGAPMFPQPVMQAPYQPVYIPVYYPYPAPASQPAYAPAPIAQEPVRQSASVQTMAPSPAPEYLKPTPSPYALAAELQEAHTVDASAVMQPAPQPVQMPTQMPVAPVATPQTEQPQEEAVQDELDPTKEWRVRCPRCGRELLARETSPYHRCPNCDKVFKLQKYRAYTKNTEA